MQRHAVEQVFGDLTKPARHLVAVGA